jgi:hypothetical protein
MVLLLSGLVQAAPPRAEPDPLTPADAEAVLTINISQLVQSPLAQKRALPPLRTALAHNTGVQQLLKTAEIDPLRDLQRITVCLSGPPGKGGRQVAILRGKFKPEKIRAAAAQVADRVKAHAEGSVTVYEIVSDKPVYAAFVDDTTLVATPSKQETLKVVQGAGRPAGRLSANLQAALEQLRGTESIWMVMQVTATLQQAMKGDQEAQDFARSLKFVVGKIEVEKDAQARFLIRTTDAAAANQLYRKLDELTPVLAFLAAGKDASARLAKNVLDTLKVSADKTDVSITLSLTDAMIEKALTPAK